MNNNVRHGCLGSVMALVLTIHCFSATLLSGSVHAGSRGEKNLEAETITQVLKERTEALMSVPGVVGTGQGLCDGKPCIKVYVVQKTPELEQQIRGILDPYPWSIQESGRFRSR